MQNIYRLSLIIAIYLQASSASSSQIFQEKSMEADAQSNSSVPKLVLWNRNYEADYMRAAIENIIALSSNQYGEVELTSSRQYEQARAFAEMANNGSVDIFVGGVDKKRERQANIILAPVDRGLLGLRVCLIHKKSSKFQSIDSLNKLQQKPILFGVGSTWPDKNVFRKAGLKTVVSPTYDSLFRMLAAQRFDCFSRSIAEVTHELQIHHQKPIALETDLLFTYPFAEFIFVSRASHDLAERLRYGFSEAVKNKSFFILFDKHHKETLKRLNVSKRRVIALDNYDISEHSRQAIAHYGVDNFFKINTQTTITQNE